MFWNWTWYGRWYWIGFYFIQLLHIYNMVCSVWYLIVMGNSLGGIYHWCVRARWFPITYISRTGLPLADSLGQWLPRRNVKFVHVTDFHVTTWNWSKYLIFSFSNMFYMRKIKERAFKIMQPEQNEYRERVNSSVWEQRARPSGLTFSISQRMQMSGIFLAQYSLVSR